MPKPGENISRMPNSSNLPINIIKDSNHLARSGRALHEKAGPYAPKPGPTLPKLETTSPKDSVSSSPINIKATQPTKIQIKYNKIKVFTVEIVERESAC